MLSQINHRLFTLVHSQLKLQFQIILEIILESVQNTSGKGNMHCCPSKYMDLFPRILPLVEIVTPGETTSLDDLTGFPCHTLGGGGFLCSWFGLFQCQDIVGFEVTIRGGSTVSPISCVTDIFFAKK